MSDNMWTFDSAQYISILWFFDIAEYGNSLLGVTKRMASVCIFDMFNMCCAARAASMANSLHIFSTFDFCSLCILLLFSSHVTTNHSTFSPHLTTAHSAFYDFLHMLLLFTPHFLHILLLLHIFATFHYCPLHILTTPHSTFYYYSHFPTAHSTFSPHFTTASTTPRASTARSSSAWPPPAL